MATVSLTTRKHVDPSTKNRSKWHIRLGENEWIKHTYFRCENDDIKLLGSVRRGAQVGALAINQDGQFFQVVGDYLVPLNKSQVAKALAAASINPYLATSYVKKAVPVTPPVVIVKRRRIAVIS
jgi:hypothetical protein